MHKITFELLFQIIGIGSASGIIYKNNLLYIIGDNAGYLYEYELISSATTKIQLIGNSKESIPKKDKPDFEAITYFENNLYIFGSGSTEKRNQMVQIETTNREIISRTDLTNLYLKMQKVAQMNPEDFNIEGVIFTGESWYFFNRGNGKSGKNVLFTIQGKELDKDTNTLSDEILLPSIKGVLSSFTDAILVEDKIYFLATAEDSNSTYYDGEIMGSIIGSINMQTMKVDFTKQITDSKKLEGLTLYKNSADKIEFLLCEDNDSEEMKANVYRLVLMR